MSLPVAIAQINVTVGDITGNIERILAAHARVGDARLVVFPELCICGYPPEDLVLRPVFVDACREAVERLARETKNGAAMLVGSPWREGDAVHNAALLLAEGRVAGAQYKRRLPNYGVFDERRIFTPGVRSEVFEIAGMRLGVLVCEDLWHKGACADFSSGVDLLVVINASPYEQGKPANRHHVAARAAAQCGAKLLYVNLVGGQDDIVFDGGSFLVDAEGKIVSQWERFRENIGIIPPSPPPAKGEKEAEIWSALALGLRDYVRKNNFPGVVLGLSGGIDSAVTAALAVDALGAGSVLGVLLPSPHTSRESVEDARALAKNLGIRTQEVPIAPGMEALGQMLDPVMEKKNWRNELLIGGNVQSRLRMVSLMAISNATGLMLLDTGNKSEIATGYATLYGDTCGGYAPLKDVYKTQIYALARWRNAQGAAVPQNSIARAPTAELVPGQKDQDQLPPYEVLDAILALLIEGRRSTGDIVQQGFDRQVVEKVAQLLRGSEYKRRQMPPGPKISPMHLIRDWRYPLTSGWKY